MVSNIKSKECVADKSVNEVVRNSGVNITKVHKVALNVGGTADNITDTQQKVNTGFFYNSKVKPAVVEADLARKFKKGEL